MQDKSLKSAITKLPISNKKRAYDHVTAIIFWVTGFIFLIYLLTRNLNTMYLFILMIFFVLIYAIPYIKRHNIKEAYLNTDRLIILLKKGDVHISFNDIISIVSEISYYADKNGELSVTYTLHLKSKYSFGNKLFLKYKFNKQNLEPGPEEINIIRKKIEKYVT